MNKSNISKPSTKKNKKVVTFQIDNPTSSEENASVKEHTYSIPDKFNMLINWYGNEYSLGSLPEDMKELPPANEVGEFVVIFNLLPKNSDTFAAHVMIIDKKNYVTDKHDHILQLRVPLSETEFIFLDEIRKGKTENEILHQLDLLSQTRIPDPGRRLHEQLISKALTHAETALGEDAVKKLTGIKHKTQEEIDAILKKAEEKEEKLKSEKKSADELIRQQQRAKEEAEKKLLKTLTEICLKLKNLDNKEDLIPQLFNTILLILKNVTKLGIFYDDAVKETIIQFKDQLTTLLQQTAEMSLKQSPMDIEKQNNLLRFVDAALNPNHSLGEAFYTSRGVASLFKSASPSSGNLKKLTDIKARLTKHISPIPKKA